MQTRFFRHILKVAAPMALFAALSLPAHSNAQAAATTGNQDHIVSSQALQQQVETSSSTRQKNIDILNQLVATPTAVKAMRDAHVDPQQVKTAIPTLSNQDLANLATRATNAQQDFAAGHIGPGLFTVIVLAIIVIIIVIVVH